MHEIVVLCTFVGSVAREGAHGNRSKLLHRWTRSRWSATSRHQGWSLQPNTRSKGL